MKPRTTAYFAVICALFGILLLAELTMPRRFSWEITFAPNDRQPFGCFVFDSILSQAMPHGYRVETTSVRNLKDSLDKHKNYLILDDYFSIDSLNIVTLDELIRRGHSVAIISAGLSIELVEKLELGNLQDQSVYHFSLLGKGLQRDTIIWADDRLYGPRQFMPASISNTMVSIKEPIKPGPWTVHARQTSNGYDFPCVLSRNYGKGRLVLATTPMLFTNFGMLDTDISQYVARVLSLLYDDVANEAQDAPLVRLTSYATYVSATEEQSPLRYVLSSTPLRWALYTALFTILLFMCFTARRRERAIPIIREPGNRQTEFARLIGTLYYQRGDHADLLRKKYAFFAEQLRRELLVDIDNAEEDASSFSRIAMHTGLPQERIAAQIRRLRATAADPEAVIKERTLHEAFDEMEQIITRI